MTENATFTRVEGWVQVDSAPETDRWSLPGIAMLDPRHSTVGRDTITIGRADKGLGQITWRVTGWDPVEACLLVERVSVLKVDP